MSSNKGQKRQILARMWHFVKSVFVARDRKLRAVWRLVLAILAFFVWTNGITMLLSYGFDALFTAWGVTKLNLAQAPGYVRFLAAHYGNLISIVSSLGVAAFACLAAPARERLRPHPKLFAVGVLVGSAVVLVAAVCFRAFDSVRATSASPSFTWTPVILLPVLLAAAVAEEFFARGYVLRMVAARANRVWGFLASAAVFLYVTGGYALGILGVVNMLLFSLVLCALSEKWPNWLNVGIRFGWGYVVTSLLAFPGTSGGTPVVTLYAVSENGLTGGNGGLISGFYMTAVLATAAWFLLLRGVRIRIPFPRRKKRI